MEIKDKEVSNIIVISLTFIGFIIGFINEELRILAWSISLIILTIIILFIIFKRYIKQIETNTADIKKFKKDLNIEKRLTILETRFENYSKKS